MKHNILDILDEKTMEVIEKLGEHFAASQMFGGNTLASGVIAVLECITSGMTPYDLANKRPLVGGKKPTVLAMSVASKFLQVGGKIDWINYGEDGVEASARFIYRSFNNIITYNIEEARTAGLFNEDTDSKDFKKYSPWYCYRPNMLRKSLIMKARLIAFPDIFECSYSPEELGGSDGDDRVVSEEEESLDQIQRIVSESPNVVDLSDVGDLSNIDELFKKFIDESCANSEFYSTSILKYLRHKKWLKEGGDIMSLPIEKKEAILRNSKKFLSLVDAFAEYKNFKTKFKGE
jgi:hypothetical protein